MKKLVCGVSQSSRVALRAKINAVAKPFSDVNIVKRFLGKEKKECDLI